MSSTFELHTYDLSSIPDYNRLPAVLDGLSEQYGTANQVYEALGQHGLNDVFGETSPNGYETILSSKFKISHELGAIVLQGTGIEKVADQTAQLLSITLGSVYGTPTKTDRKLAQIAWPIKYTPEVQVIPTFSQTLGEAAYHTDTQYFQRPEKYFGLFCIESDVPGKGTNHLIHIKDIVDALSAQDQDRTLNALSQPFPFRVPSSFTRSGKDEDIEITWAPIIDDGRTTIRYRKDTIDRALLSENVMISEEQQIALEELEAALAKLKPLQHHLQPGEAILINNYKLLHARTSFDDPARSLFRVRMNEAA